MITPLRIKENYSTDGLYRMPWTKTDNSNAWLSITRACDISCEYCVQEHAGQKHKSLEEILFELDELLRLRKCDTIQIAGGEPLTHPELLDIVRLVRSRGIKPFLITNGVRLDRELLRKLKEAGLFGFILHVDSGQNRPGWAGRSEGELNELRRFYADMIHEEKGLICSFITTITPKSLPQVSEIVQWCRDNIDRVIQVIFVPVRSFHAKDPWNFYVNGKRIDIGAMALCHEQSYANITAKDLFSEVKKVLPDYEFNSFLGGSQVSDAPKWLFGLYAATEEKFYGNVGNKGIEIIQSVHHLIFGRFVAFFKPWVYRTGRLIFLLSAFDKPVRKTLRKRFASILANPARIFNKMFLQAVIVMQPFDILPNGESDMCDGCPNMTVWNGRLVSECRMEEYINHGQLIQFEYTGERREYFAPVVPGYGPDMKETLSSIR